MTTRLFSIGAAVVRKGQRPQSRQFWQWLNAVFNKVDEDRIKAVGPDRAAAEWLIRCGASVKWAGAEHFHSDYNTLPATSSRNYRIEEIDATDSSIMHLGFPYLKDLKLLKAITLKRCHYISDEALFMLECRKESLQAIEVISCGNVTDAGIRTLVKLT